MPELVQSRPLGIRLLAVVGGALAAAIVLAVIQAIFDVDVRVPAGLGNTETVELQPMRAAGVTILASAIGVIVAIVAERRMTNPQQWWTRAAVIGVVVSFVPSLVLGEGVGSRPVLLALHVVAAGVVIPMVRATLPTSSRANEVADA